MFSIIKNYLYEKIYEREVISKTKVFVKGKSIVDCPAGNGWYSKKIRKSVSSILTCDIKPDKSVIKQDFYNLIGTEGRMLVCINSLFVFDKNKFKSVIENFEDFVITVPNIYSEHYTFWKKKGGRNAWEASLNKVCKLVEGVVVGEIYNSPYVGNRKEPAYYIVRKEGFDGKNNKRD